MILKTILLVSPDPDDHVEFSEALDEISDRAILVTVSNSAKALELVRSKRLVPDHVVLDLRHSDQDVRWLISGLLESMKGKQNPLIVFGDKKSLSDHEFEKPILFLDEDLTYAERRMFLETLIK